MGEKCERICLQDSILARARMERRDRSRPDRVRSAYVQIAGPLMDVYVPVFFFFQNLQLPIVLNDVNKGSQGGLLPANKLSTLGAH